MYFHNVSLILKNLDHIIINICIYYLIILHICSILLISQPSQSPLSIASALILNCFLGHQMAPSWHLPLHLPPTGLPLTNPSGSPPTVLIPSSRHTFGLSPPPSLTVLFSCPPKILMLLDDLPHLLLSCLSATLLPCPTTCIHGHTHRSLREGEERKD